MNSSKSQDIHNLSLELLLNKKMYKKIIGKNGICNQTQREDDERKKYMIQYKNQILNICTQLLNSDEKFQISHEIQSLFYTFVDKCVKHFHRMNQIKNPIDYEKDEDEKYEDEDAYDNEDYKSDDGRNDDGRNDDGDDGDDGDDEGKYNKSNMKSKMKSNKKCMIDSMWGDKCILDNK